MPPPGTIAGGRLSAVLGRGGTAEVAVWSSDSSSRKLACKYPLSEKTEDVSLFRSLARREWDLIGGWKFPGVVRLHSCDENYDHLLMELCEGPTLDSARPFTPYESIALLSAISVSLAAIHAKGILHCDIKPQNIFLPSDWKKRVSGEKIFYVKYSDFSLGRILTEPESSRLGVGTVGYAAPETINHGLTSIQSELFSLGVVAWQLFSGKHPFITDADNADPVAISSRVSEEMPTTLSQIIPACDARLSDLVASLLAKSPEDRPQSAWEVCRILRVIGCRHPLEKAIRPSFLTAGNGSHESVERVLKTTTTEIRRLRTISGGNIATSLSILDHNLRNGRIEFDGSIFETKSTLLWPSRSRRAVLEGFRKLTLGQKKNVIRRSVFAACIVNGQDNSTGSCALDEILLHLLSPKSVRRIAQKGAVEARDRGQHSLAVNLFVRSGNLPEAIVHAELASTEFTSNHDSEAALGIIRHVIRYAELKNSLFEARNLLMIQGDILKQTGQADEAKQIYLTITSLYSDRRPDRLLAECYKDIGDICKMKQTFQEGIEALGRALEIYRLLDDELEISHTLNNIGNIHWVKLDLKQAVKHYREALHIQRRLEVAPDIASTLNNLGSCQIMQGRFRRGLTLYQNSLKIARSLGNDGEIARTLNNMGYTYHVMGQPSRSVDMLQESLAINRKIGSKKEVLFNLENLTQVMIGAGQLLECIPLLEEGVALSLGIGDSPHHGTFLLNRALVARRLGDFGAAEMSVAQGEQVSESTDSATLKLSLLLTRAALRFSIGDTSAAVAIARQSEELSRVVNDKPSRLNALMYLVRMTGDQKYCSDGMLLSDELGLTREKHLLKAWLLEYELSNERIPIELVQEVTRSVESFSDDLEQSSILCTLATYHQAVAEYGKAASVAKTATQISENLGLLPEQARSLLILGQVQCAAQDFESGYHSFRRALALCKKMAETIQVDSDRAMYLDQAWIKCLFSEVRRIASILGQKKGQVVA